MRLADWWSRLIGKHITHSANVRADPPQKVDPDYLDVAARQQKIIEQLKRLDIEVDVTTRRHTPDDHG